MGYEDENSDTSGFAPFVGAQTRRSGYASFVLALPNTRNQGFTDKNYMPARQWAVSRPRTRKQFLNRVIRS